MSDYWDEDGEPIVREANEWRHTRKPRTCDACKETIPVRGRYFRQAALWGGTWSVTARCERCQAIYAHLSGRMETDGEYLERPHDELNCGHSYRERWGEDPRPEIAALAFWLPGESVG